MTKKIIKKKRKNGGYNIMDKNIIICNSLTKLVTDISREIGYLDSREGQTKNAERKASIVKKIETAKARLDDFLALLDTKEEPKKFEWKPEIGFTEEGGAKIKMPYIVRDENFDIWLNYRTCVAQFFEEFVSEHVDKPFDDCLFYVKFIYPETIDESMFGDHKEMALKWSAIFLGVRSPSSIGSGNFVGEKMATEIYLLPKDKYDGFKIKYLKN